MWCTGGRFIPSFACIADCQQTTTEGFGLVRCASSTHQPCTRGSMSTQATMLYWMHNNMCYQTPFPLLATIHLKLHLARPTYCYISTRDPLCFSPLSASFALSIASPTRCPILHLAHILVAHTHLLSICLTLLHGPSLPSLSHILALLSVSPSALECWFVT